MTTIEELERRLSAVEAQVAELQRTIQRTSVHPKNSLVGCVGNDPDFAKVIEFVREFRAEVDEEESQR